MTPPTPLNGAILRSPLLLLARAEINRNTIDVFPDDPRQPRGPLAVPKHSDNSGFGNWQYSPRNWFNHTYIVENVGPASLKGETGLAAVGEALRRRPTPGKAHPATVGGTLNDVGPLIGPDQTWLDDIAQWYSPSNFVYSYLLVSPRIGVISPMILNYTQHGHHMIDEGFVLRYAKLDGAVTISLISYGEGNSFRQSWATSSLTGWKETVKRVWARNHELIFADAVSSSAQPT